MTTETTDQYFIDSSDGGLSRDAGGHDQLPRYIGPFPSWDAAKAYLKTLGPLWGAYTVPKLTAPEDVRGSEGQES